MPYGALLCAEYASGYLELDLTKEDMDAEKEVLIEPSRIADGVRHLVTVALHQGIEGQRGSGVQLLEAGEISRIRSTELAQCEVVGRGQEHLHASSTRQHP